MFLLLLLIISTSACASTSGMTSAQNDGVVYNEKKQNHKKLLFEDWKYRGFGQTLPGWFESAYEDNLVKIKKSVDENFCGCYYNTCRRERQRTK